MLDRLSKFVRGLPSEVYSGGLPTIILLAGSSIGLAYDVEVMTGLFDCAAYVSSILGRSQIGFPVYPAADQIEAIWGSVVQVHAAFAAIAPTLGYALLSVTVKEFSPLAPASVLVAQAIRWRDYLAFSLLTLMASFVASQLAQSFMGLCLAIIGMLLTIGWTLWTFSRGYALITSPIKLERLAMHHLSTLARRAGKRPKPSISPNTKRAADRAAILLRKHLKKSPSL